MKGKEIHNKLMTFAVIVITILFQYSCAPVYVPTVINQPLFTGKGDFKASLHGGISGWDLQSAYALTDHIGVMAMGSFEDFKSDENDDYHKHLFGEVGGGYFNTLGPFGRLEVYGGGGIGKINVQNGSGYLEDYSNAILGKVFIQPGIGISSDYVDLSFASRFVWADILDESVHHNRFFYEPAITGKVGYKKVKGVLQVGFSAPLGEKTLDFAYQPFIISFGIQANFNLLKKK